MIHKIFCVYDEKACAYLPPFFLPEAGQAIRVFTDCVNSKDHQFGAHPSDYTLFHIGEYDDNSAKIHAHAPKTLGNGVEFRFIQTDSPEVPYDEVRNVESLSANPERGNSA